MGSSSRRGSDGPPGREPGPARTRVRRSWYGHGTLTRVEKTPVSCFLHDLFFTFADVSIAGLPALVLVVGNAGSDPFGAATAALVAWLTMAAVAAAIRGGWLSPVATDTPGWISITLPLVVLRLLYYNLVLGVAAFGSVAAAAALGTPPASLALAFGLALAATLAIPRLAESVSRRVVG